MFCYKRAINNSPFIYLPSKCYVCQKRANKTAFNEDVLTAAKSDSVAFQRAYKALYSFNLKL